MNDSGPTNDTKPINDTGPTNDSADLEELDRETSLKLLASVDVGRLAWHDADRVVIYPLNFALDRDDIIFRTPSHAIQEVAHLGRTLSFQADDFEPAIRTGWTVLVSGRAVEVTDPAELTRIRELVTPWRRATNLRLMRLHVESVAGRRLPTPLGAIETVFVDD